MKEETRDTIRHITLQLAIAEHNCGEMREGLSDSTEWVRIMDALIDMTQGLQKCTLLMMDVLLEEDMMDFDETELDLVFEDDENDI